MKNLDFDLQEDTNLRPCIKFLGKDGDINAVDKLKEACQAIDLLNDRFFIIHDFTRRLEKKLDDLGNFVAQLARDIRTIKNIKMMHDAQFFNPHND